MAPDWIDRLNRLQSGRQRQAEQTLDSRKAHEARWAEARAFLEQRHGKEEPQCRIPDSK